VGDGADSVRLGDPGFLKPELIGQDDLVEILLLGLGGDGMLAVAGLREEAEFH
jgi:hypothetical protein